MLLLKDMLPAHYLKYAFPGVLIPTSRCTVKGLMFV
jgi:hypothetical protein